MTVSVQTAIYRLKYEGLDEAYKAAAALGKVEVAEEKLTKATRASAAGFERTLGTLDPAIMAYQRYQQALEKVTRWETAGIGTAQQRNHLVEQATQRYAAATAALGRVGVANDNMSKKVGLGAHEMRNLSFQVNDVATMLASGSSPFQVLATQGGQFYQILSGANGGITGALKGLFASLMAFLGPLGLLAVGVAAVAAAAYGLYSYLKTEGPTAEKLLTEHDRLLKIVKDSYDKVTNSAKNWYDQSKAVTQLQLIQQEIDLRQKLTTEIDRSTKKLFAVDYEKSGNMTWVFKVKDEYKAFSSAIENLAESYQKGTPNVAAFTDEIAKIALVTPALQKLGAELVNSVGDASKFAAALKQTQDMMEGIKTGTFTGDQRGRLGLAEPTKAQVNAYDQLIQRTKDRIAEMKLEATTAGQTAGAVMQLKLQHDAERAAKQAGVQVNQAVLDQLKEEMVATDRLLQLKRVRADIDFDRQTLGLSAEDAQIASRLAQLYDNDVPRALNSTEAAAMRANNRLREMQEITSGFGNDLANGLLRGEDAMRSMTNAATNLISKLASAQLNRFLNGNFQGGSQSMGSAAGLTTIAAAGLNGYQSGNAGMGALSGGMAGFAVGGVPGAAIGAIAGAVGGLIGAADQAEQKLEESKRRWKEMGTQVIAFNAAAAGMDLGPLTQQLNSLHSSFMSLVNTAAEAEDWAAVVRLQTSYMKGIYRTVNEFANGAQNLTPLESAIKGINDEAIGLKETLEVMGQLTPDLARSIDEGLIRRLNETRIAFDEAAAAAGRARAAGYADQLFDVVNDTSTLAGALAALERKTAKEREAEATAGGQALAALDELYFAERNKIVADFNDKAQAEQQKLYDDQLKAAEDAAEAQRRVAQDLVEFVQNISKTIKDYLQGLKTGANSILSPQAQLDAAQANFNSTLTLAQGGNRDALSSITQVASTLLDQAKSFYASSSGYTAIYNQVTSALEGIQNIAPEVVGNSDAALIAAVNATTSAVAATTSAVSGTTGAVNTVANATNTQNTLIESQTALIGASNSLLTAANNLASSTNALLDAIRGLNDTAAQQLTLLRGALSPSSLNFVFSTALGNGTVQNVSVNNQMVEALNKIVINTWAISRNTAFQVSNASQATIGVFGDGGLVGGRPHSQGGTMINAERDEYVVQKAAVDYFGVDFLDNINARRMPVMPIAPPVARSGANDNRDVVQAVNNVSRTFASGLSRMDGRLAALEAAIVGTGKQNVEAVKEAGSRPARPGTRVGTG